MPVKRIVRFAMSAGNTHDQVEIGKQAVACAQHRRPKGVSPRSMPDLESDKDPSFNSPDVGLTYRPEHLVPRMPGISSSAHIQEHRENRIDPQVSQES